MERDTAMAVSGQRDRYDFAAIESKWQKRWQEQRLYEAPANPRPDDKFYMLVMFAYPSGDIHMGHFRNYIIGDACARKQMMMGKDVLHPFGWDSFGLPAERAAIKRNIHPADWTDGVYPTGPRFTGIRLIQIILLPV